ncbi:ATP-dependent DNA helicase [Mycena chlorophos]|uniref:ATP-dependent DNA helicase n=1 Tax=Mycena chlorophos TaxID=658473 RepID=A0A8H6TNP6_MYCCL|nr:ATP-dependent DNA helicase [Mycena chlorophos]
MNEDENQVLREHAGYVPPPVDSESDVDESEERASSPLSGNHPTVWAQRLPNSREVIPLSMSRRCSALQPHGTIDVAADSVTDSQLFSAAVDNLLPVHRRRYTARPGSQFVSEYARTVNDEIGAPRISGTPGNANHVLGCFPVLYPYGLGGLEVDRQRNVTYEAHLKWALQYEDGRFRKDLYFMFQAFGVLQKRSLGSLFYAPKRREEALRAEQSDHFDAAAELGQPADCSAARRELSEDDIRIGPPEVFRTTVLVTKAENQAHSRIHEPLSSPHLSMAANYVGRGRREGGQWILQEDEQHAVTRFDEDSALVRYKVVDATSLLPTRTAQPPLEELQQWTLPQNERILVNVFTTAEGYVELQRALVLDDLWATLRPVFFAQSMYGSTGGLVRRLQEVATRVVIIGPDVYSQQEDVGQYGLVVPTRATRCTSLSA